MNRSELLAEINRIETALRKTASHKLKSDYGKYLKRLYKDLKYYDKNYGKRTELNSVYRTK